MMKKEKKNPKPPFVDYKKILQLRVEEERL